MTHRKKILVLESEKLLAASMLSLLASRTEFDVSHTTVTSLACLDPPDVPPPDVIILDEELLAANLLAVVKLADRYPELRLIVIGLKKNKLQVFDKHMVKVRQSSDFLDLL